MGKIDWNALLAAFETIGHNGVFNMECSKKAHQSAKAVFDAYNRC